VVDIAKHLLVAAAALRCGGEIDFIDIEWGTYNIDLGLLKDRLKRVAQKTGCRKYWPQSTLLGIR
jgi:hypothetical protein